MEDLIGQEVVAAFYVHRGINTCSYQSVPIMDRRDKTSEDFCWTFVHVLKGNNHYPANFPVVCFAPVTVNLFLFLECFFPPLRFHMCFSFCLEYSSPSLSPLPCNFLIIFIIWFKSYFLRETFHIQSKAHLFFLIDPVIFPL